MAIRPILASLRKHKIAAALIVLEIALACAVFCNAVFMISQRIAAMHVPDAIAESGISSFVVQGADSRLANAGIPRDLAALRSIPGVTAAAAINALPLGGEGFNFNVAPGPGALLRKSNPNVAVYAFTRGGPDALGLRLLRGRVFSDGEYADGRLESLMPTAHVTMVTQSLARRLWPGQSALGKRLWVGKSFSYTVVGVVADVLRPNMNGEGATGFHWAVFFPLASDPSLVLSGHYVVRSAPEDRARVIRDGMRKLQALAPNAVVKGRMFTAIRHDFFDSTRSMIGILVLVCVIMLAVTAFGIVGLTSFWVRQRRRQIGIRRAVGATRRDIVQYFQTENFLLSTAGVVLGMMLAFGINLYLMQHYQLNRMPAWYLPVSAVALWILGQLAVLGPALRASNVPPVVATRSA